MTPSSSLRALAAAVLLSTIRNGAALDMASRRSVLATGATATATWLARPPLAPAATTTAAAPPAIPTWTLENGVIEGSVVQMPLLALNTVGLSAETTEKAVSLAVASGISHIDFHPGAERDGVGRYIKGGSTENRRAGLFLTTKIRKAPPGTTSFDAANAAAKQIDEDLLALGVEQTDMLMLRDSPDKGVIQTQWRALEEALRAGKTRSIGVVNFCEGALGAVLDKKVTTNSIVPAVNYYMLHPGMGSDAHGLKSFGESRGVKTFAYGAVGEPGPAPELVSGAALDPTIDRIAKAHRRAPEEVALRWNLQNGAAVSVRPTTQFALGTSTCDDTDSVSGACRAGLRSRADSFSWSLTAKDMEQLDALTAPDGNPTLFSSAGCPDAFVFPAATATTAQSGEAADQWWLPRAPKSSRKA